MANSVLAVIYASLNRMEEGRAAIQRLLAVDPDYAIADVRNYYSGKFKNGADLDRLVQCLRQAGLPG